MNELGKYMTEQYNNERQLEETISARKVRVTKQLSYSLRLFSMLCVYIGSCRRDSTARRKNPVGIN